MLCAEVVQSTARHGLPVLTLRTQQRQTTVFRRPAPSKPKRLSNSSSCRVEDCLGGCATLLPSDLNTATRHEQNLEHEAATDEAEAAGLADDAAVQSGHDEQLVTISLENLKRISLCMDAHSLALHLEMLKRHCPRGAKPRCEMVCNGPSPWREQRGSACSRRRHGTARCIVVVKLCNEQ